MIQAVFTTLFFFLLYQGNYNEAFEYFSRASEAAKTLNNLPLTDEIKTYCGIAKAHKLMLAFNSHVEAEDAVGLKYLLAWKENRSDMCTDPLTVGKALVMKHISAVLSSTVKSFFSCRVLLDYFLGLSLVLNGG